MADIKSINTLLAELRTYLSAKNRSIDTSDNSLIKDIVLTPYAIGGKLLLDQVGLVKDLHVLSRLTGTDLDDEGTNYKLERLLGSYATVTLTYWSNTLPTANVSIPAGSQVRTGGTNFTSPVTFSVINSYVFLASRMGTYYVHDRDRYEFTVTARCDTLGTTGNIGAELISVLVSAITQIGGVTNLSSAIGGQDVELDDAFRERIRLAKTGRDINTVNGLRLFLMSLGFTDCYPVRVEDADAEKATGIDAFVVDNTVTAYSESFTYDPHQSRYYLTKRPVLEVTEISGSIVGVLDASKYDVTIDTSSPMRRSVVGQDYFEIRGSSGMTYGETITVTYNYDSFIAQSQDTLALVTNKVLTADVLIKRAYPLFLYINATFTLKANADGPTTRTTAKNALAQFMNTYRLGDDVQKSDLILVLQQGYGDFPIDTVDYVVINSYTLQDEFGVSYLPVGEVITVSNKQYAVYGAAQIS